SKRRHTKSKRDWSSDVCSSDLGSLLYIHRQVIVDSVLFSSALQGWYMPFQNERPDQLHEHPCRYDQKLEAIRHHLCVASLKLFPTPLVRFEASAGFENHKSLFRRKKWCILVFLPHIHATP